MVWGQGQLGRLKALGRKTVGSKGEGSCQGIGCRGPRSRILVAAGVCRRDLASSNASLSASGGLLPQLQGVGKGLFMCSNELC